MKPSKLFLIISVFSFIFYPSVSFPNQKGKWRRSRSKTGVFPSNFIPISFQTKLVQQIQDDSFIAYGENIKIRTDGKRKFSYQVGSHHWKRAKKLPCRIKFKTSFGWRAILLRKNLRGKLSWSSHYGCTIILNRKIIRIIDLDADNILGESQEDGICGPNAQIVGVFYGQAWTEKSGYDLKFEKNKYSLKVFTKKIFLKRKNRDLHSAWALFNCWRQKAGSAPLTWNEKMAKDCKKHLIYSSINNVQGHTETPGKIGYTPEGEKAGLQSVLGYANTTYLGGVIEQFRTAYHCAKMLQPELKSSGMSIYRNFFGCNVIGDLSGSAKYNGPIIFVWPPSGAKKVFTTFNSAGENPMPVYGQQNNYRLLIGQIIMAKVNHNGPYNLIVKEYGKKEIPVYLTSPSISASKYGKNGDLVIASPKKPLRKNCKYIAILTLGENQNKIIFRWSFFTGRR